MLKFTSLSVFATLAWMTAFNPSNEGGLPSFNLLDMGYLPKFDASGYNPKIGHYYMGADTLAQSILYFALFYKKFWNAGLLCIAFDLAYYGPKTAGGPFAALLASMTLI